MDKNRTEGRKHEIKGAVKETVVKVTGNASKEIAGNIEKNAGKIQNAVGQASDEIRHDEKQREKAARKAANS